MAIDQHALRLWISTELDRMPRGAKSQFANHMGLTNTQVSRLIQLKPGKEARDVNAHEIPLLISFFGKAPPGFEGSAQSEIALDRGEAVRARVIGTVEAGAFREVDDMDQSEAVDINVPPDDDFPNARLLVFNVAGDSMNALPGAQLVPGSRAICLAYEDVAHRFPLRDGLVVVVERTKEGGHLREWSIKQLEIRDDHYEFHPRSTNPAHKPFSIPIDYDADDGMKVEVIAILRRVLTGTLNF